jgi:hypothetical protein
MGKRPEGKTEKDRVREEEWLRSMKAPYSLFTLFTRKPTGAQLAYGGVTIRREPRVMSTRLHGV